MSDETARRGFKPRARTLSDEEIKAAAARDLAALKDDTQFSAPASPSPKAVPDGERPQRVPPVPSGRQTAQRRAAQPTDEGPQVHLQVRMSKRQRALFLSAVKLSGTSAQAVIGEFVKTYVAKTERS